MNDTTSFTTIDIQLGIKLAGGNLKLATELLQHLCENIKDDQLKIQSAFIQKSWSTLQYHVHQLHGASCYCSVPTLTLAVKNLETALAMTQPINVIESMIQTLNQIIENMLTEYQILLLLKKS